MMTDFELLELAAKAMGFKAICYEPYPEEGFHFPYAKIAKRTYFDPFQNDGDVLRLAVKLRLTICHFSDCVGITHHLNSGSILGRQDGIDVAATRRAAIHAAAQIQLTKQGDVWMISESN